METIPYSPEMPAGVGIILILFFLLFALIATAIAVFLWCRIYSKTGYSWAMGLLMLIHLGNIVLLFILAFSTWPIQKELELLRSPTGG